MLRSIIASAPRRTLAAARPVASAVTMRAAMPALRFYSEKAEKAEEKPAEEDADAEAGEVHPLQKELDSCKTKLDEKDKQAAQFKDKYLRAVADFQNLQTRTVKEVSDAKDYALTKFAKDLLESVDNFDRALAVVAEDKRNDPVEHKEIIDLYEGVKMTQNVFEKTLQKYGITKINPVGEKFDPNLHEATFQAPQADKEPGTVFFVQQTGFMLNGRVLRAAKVGIVLEQE
ncbi:uncharacterized protein SAPINGB_P006070 [Magnusiomyces paraingens]|uniref:GrpE protein homolog n=1 Tax=Magnusiomyces paraingens TaxID=2606893 RepID=A0A5E8CA92_9ASCO|nr:uncharacterized protein SAPINGB_P006070 [Saprochaete ingens]VVT58166.1 unnamed protein product [Saprochaete ingens]